MTTIVHVAFDTDAETNVVGVFGDPQSTDLFPHQADIPSDDSRYETFYEVQGIWASSMGLVKPGE
jgi:hypothetical protein